MQKITNIKLFISCPGDVKNEPDSIRLITEEINKTSGEQSGYKLETLNWKTDVYSGIGTDPQDVINLQVDSKYDILIGIIWQKIGTPTKRDKSGTIEEINRAVTSKKNFLVYFNTTPPEDLNKINPKELAKVNSFKKELSSKGILYTEYSSIDNFESYLKIHLINLIHDKLIKNKTKKKRGKKAKTKNPKYELISSAIKKVEQNDTTEKNNLDIFVLVEEVLSALGIVNSCMNSITESTNDFTEKLGKRTSEMNKFFNIKDHRLRMGKIKIVVELLANEMDEFSSRIKQELSSFSLNLRSIGPNYSKILLQTDSYENQQEVVELKESVLVFRDSIEGATEKGASLLETILKWPVLTPKFNTSKREMEVTLKNLVKEMFESLKLMDEAING